MLLTDLLLDRATAEPERPAIAVDGSGTLTYGAWEARSNAFARGLAARGVSPGDRVALYFGNPSWTEFAVAYAGTAKAGAVSVPVSPRFPAADLDDVLERCAVSGTVTATGDVQVRRGFLAHAEEIEADHPDDRIVSPVKEDDLAEVLFTSGTTGVPKGVACTHAHVARPLLKRGDWPPEMWRACRGGVYVHANSVSTAAGQLRLLEPLAPEAMTVVGVPVFDAERFCAVIEERRAAMIQLVPSMAAAILESGAAWRHDVSSVRVIAFGCAPLPPEALTRMAATFPGAALVNLYELSEARHAGTYALHGEAPAGSVGRPRGLTAVRVAGEDGADMPPGEVGEVLLRYGDLPPQRYFGDERATAAVFVCGWTRTGDAGFLDQDGNLTLVDRLKDLVFVGGLKVSSVEVERVLTGHPAVREAAVVGVPGAAEGERVVAVVALSGAADPAELREHARQRLPAFKAPTEIVVRESLPRNASGKVLKRELRDELMARPRVAPAAAHGTAGVVAAVWADVLGLRSVGPSDDFVASGGTSLSATQVASRLCEALGVEVTAAAVIERGSVERLAAGIEAERAALPVAPAIIPRRRRAPDPGPPAVGTGPPLPRAS